MMLPMALAEAALAPLQEEASQHNTRLQAITSSHLEAEAQVEALQEELEQLEPEFQQHLASMPPEQRAAYLAAQDEARSHAQHDTLLRLP